MPSEELVLEIGEATWAIPGDRGVASLSSGVPPTVRVLREAGCEVLAEVDATPGEAYVVRFATDGSASIEEWTDPADGGAPLERREPVDCR